MSYLLKYNKKHMPFKNFTLLLLSEFKSVKIDRLKGEKAANLFADRIAKFGLPEMKNFGKKLLDKKYLSAYFEIFNENTNKVVFGFYYYPHAEIHIEHEKPGDSIYKDYLKRLEVVLDGHLFES